MRLLVLLIGSSICFSTAFGQFSEDQENRPLSAPAKKALMDSLITRVRDEYVFDDKARQISKGLQKFSTTKNFEKITDYNSFSAAINAALQQLTTDKHLRVLYSYDTVPVQSQQQAPIPEFIKQFAIKNNYGFNKLEILSGNIGYMNILGFFPYEETIDIAIGAFHFIENTSALIVDLRQNSGGESNMATFVTSHFFSKEPVNLGTVRYRKNNRIEQTWSAYYLPGKRYVNKPVYILTSRQTFSAGEAMAAILKSHVRAVIVGEQTGGAENMCDLVRLNEHVVLNLPVACTYPENAKNTEGAGVKPDMQIDADHALDAAHAAALKQLGVAN